ncbi:MAG: hypothetical protein AB1726_09725 [Planctomycetota bacterium]
MEVLVMDLRPSLLLAILPLLSGFLAAGALAGPQADDVEVKAELKHASDEVVARFLQRYEAALQAKDSAGVVTVLQEMLGYDNAELLPAGEDALRYKASAEDVRAVKQEAADLGIRKPAEIKAMVARRESDVQVLGVAIVANVGGEKAGPTLHQMFKNKALRKEKPRVAAALIAGMGQVRYEKVLAEVEDEYRAYANREVMKAAIRYFGQTECKSLAVARMLAGDLDAPEPTDVDAASNPPASYWQARWEAWNFVKRDVAWALKRITGQDFRPAEDPNPGDGAKALKYIEENAKRLGLR